jgi:lysyl endopeptidase
MRKFIAVLPVALVSLTSLSVYADKIGVAETNDKAQIMSVKGEFYSPPKSATPPRAEQFVGFVPETRVTRVQALAPTFDKIEIARDENSQFEKRPGLRRGNDSRSDAESRNDFRGHQIGLPVDMPASVAASVAPGALQWSPDATGGVTARFDVTSPGAKALRLGFRVGNVPDGAVLRFAGSGEPARVFSAAADGLADSEGEYWSPIVMGETVQVEVQLASSADRGAFELKLMGASHLFADPSRPNADLQRAISKAGSQSCEVNVVCSPDAAVAQTAAAVARMVYTKGGSSFLCTGTLLNDTDPNTQRSHFYTANHCISTARVAGTLQTFWNYQSSTCGGTTSAQSTTLTGGAFLRATDFNSDITLLELKEPPPAGALFAGWNASALANNSAIIGVHHPAGDIKKLSLGTMTNNAAPGFDGKRGTYYQVVWNSGVTEGGSSGSGIFTKSGAGNYELRGGLLGGSSFCTAQSSPDIYSRLDLKFDLLRPFLAP